MTDYTEDLINAATKQVACYEGDQRLDDCFNADIMNAFFAGATWQKQQTLSEPTDEMLDAARPLFLALECDKTTVERVRQHFLDSGHSIGNLPDWFKSGRGHLTKAGRAILVWYLMKSAEPKSE